MTRSPRPTLLALFALVLLAHLDGVPAADPPGEAETVSQWIRDLGSECFDDREAAARRLDLLGRAALPGLRRARESNDAEVRRRAEELTRRISRRLDTAQYLRPKMVRLHFRDLPVREALAEFRRQTGLTVDLDDGPGRQAGSRITLDTGATTFWEAYEQFCRAAGLAEAHLLPPEPSSGFGGVGPRGPVTAEALEPLSLLAKPYGPPPARLVAGKMPALPTFRVGGLRVRALPPHVPASGLSQGEGVKQLVLEVQPEPGLSWPGVTDVLVDQAIDDQGQNLSQVLAPSRARQEVVEVWGAVRVWDANSVWVDGPPTPHQVTVPLKLGPVPARRLRELHGVLTAVVQTPPQTLLEVERVGESVGRTVGGIHGGSLRVTEFRREGGGRVTIKADLVKPEPAVNDAPAPEVGPLLAVPRAGVIRVWPEPVEKPSSSEIRLVDERGQPFALTQQSTSPSRVGSEEGVQVIHLIYQPRPGQGLPTRLEFVARRSLVVEVPFTLRDVPLR